MIKAIVFSREVIPSKSSRQDWGLSDINLLHPDSFKINPTYNSDGLIKCLQPSPPVSILKFVQLDWGGFGWQVGSPDCIRVSPKSLWEKNFCCLSNSLQRDYFISRDKVYVGLPADALVPCFLLFTETISSWYETSLPSIWTCYRLTASPWPEVHCHLPGLAKNKSPRHRRHLIKPPGRYG